MRVAAGAADLGTHDLPSGPTLRILIVDDDECDAFLVQDLLDANEESSDWEFEWRMNPFEALEALRSRTFHACLVDYRLGGENGVTFIENAQAEGMPLPFILLTGQGDRDVDLAAMRAGAAAFLDKGQLDASILERTIRYAVERARARSDLLRVARRDGLTGLHNRLSIEERIEAARTRADRKERMLGVCVLDLDGFKAVNDQCGHPVGDQLLRLVSERLLQAVRGYDTVGRVGGDEFVVVLEDLESEHEARQIAERLVAAIRPPFELSRPLPPVSASLGLALYPGCGRTPGELLQTADAAMYTAKARGKAQATVVVEPIDGGVALPRNGDEVREAARSGDLDLAFQPQVDLETGELLGVEALARWTPRGSATADTSRFIAELERTGAVVELDIWVLEQATQRLGLHACQLPRISVNVSPVTLVSPGFLSRVNSLLPVDPGRIELELTETTLLDRATPVSNILHVLRALGLRVALDDFGVGYSSLLRLRNLPVDTIKVDREFTREVGIDTRDAAIIEAIVTLGARTGVDIVVEGIETLEQAEWLRLLGIRKGQGFLYARPCLEPDLAKWMSARAVIL